MFLGHMKVYHKRDLKCIQQQSDKQSLAKKPNLVHNQESATGDPLMQ